MELADFLNEADRLTEEALRAFVEAVDAATVEAARVHFLGQKSGLLKTLQKSLGLVEPAGRAAAGKRFNELKHRLEAAHKAAVERVAAATAAPEARQVFDPTLPGTALRLGRLHPITQTIEEMKEIMGRLGFSVAEGPEVEDLWHNFDALNIPPEHPARDPLDNFHLCQKCSTGKTTQDASPFTPVPFLLRTQTSTVQIRVMEQRRPPVRIISCGRVYRPDTADATHFPMFHQMEGLMVERGVTMAHLKSTLRLFARAAFADDVHIRFRPSFFPFTEPSVEVDMSWQGGWIEMGGAGMVDPNVLRAVGYDPEEVTGFAFGLGIERIAARRYGIPDIREFFKNDVRFLRQF